MNAVASYKQPAILATDRKINFIYGLNGTGKSTLSDFFYGRSDVDFSGCSIVPPLSEETKVLVYNRTFIQDNFYNSEDVPGIFSLSKENKDAQEKIDKAQKKIEALNKQHSEYDEQLKTAGNDFKKLEGSAIEKIWKIKTDYTGGDRVLAFCLDKLNRSKEKPFEYIINIPKSDAKPEITIEQLKQEAQQLSTTDAIIDTVIQHWIFDAHSYETDPIFSKIIVGNSNSSISDFIKKLNNQDWVRQGLNFIDKQPADDLKCPFCQQKTIDQSFLLEVKSFFAGAFERDCQVIADIEKKYTDACRGIFDCNVGVFDEIGIISDLKTDFLYAHKRLIDCLNRNLSEIHNKLEHPNIKIGLIDSSEALLRVNEIIDVANQRIQEFNKKLSQKQQALEEIKKRFWKIQRWDYDQTISSYFEAKKIYDKKTNEIQQNIKDCEEQQKKCTDLIRCEQANVINIQDAIDHINSNLLGIGIVDFKIEKHRDSLYRITRTGQQDGVFHSLSEGEKMIISFLYFLELCHGKSNAEETEKKKIIVIDDPISSLSHIYVFNVSKLIDFEFFRKSNFEQIFILTHSLYFFHELHKLAPRPKHNPSEAEKKEKEPALWRIVKDLNGSRFESVSRNEILNDYQAYWSIVKNPNHPPALIANAMRNIIEYFWGFIETNELSNIFAKECFKDNRYQAFCRYINVESHSKPHLIYDYKDFDYNTFREAFHLLFTESGYQEHYDKMMGETEAELS